MRKALFEDQQGVEPLVMKLLAGLVLLAVGLGVGLAIYRGIGAQQALSYTVSVSPTGATVERENTVQASVSVERLTTYDKTVSLTAEGLPTGVTVQFSPDSGTPTFGSTMTISVSSAATLGPTTITIKATGANGTEKTTTFELTVT